MYTRKHIAAALLLCALLAGLPGCGAAANASQPSDRPSATPAPDPDSLLSRVDDGWLDQVDLNGDGVSDSVYAVCVPYAPDEGEGVTQLTVTLGGGDVLSTVFRPTPEWRGLDYVSLSAAALWPEQPPALLLTRYDRTSNYGAANLHLMQVQDGRLAEVMDSAALLEVLSAAGHDARLVGGALNPCPYDGAPALTLSLMEGGGEDAVYGAAILTDDGEGGWTVRYVDLRLDAWDLTPAAGDGDWLYDLFYAAPLSFLNRAQGLPEEGLAPLARATAQGGAVHSPEGYLDALYRLADQGLDGFPLSDAHRAVVEALLVAARPE